MKNHVKSLETFVNESGAYPVSVSSTANGTAGVPQRQLVPFQKIALFR